MGQIQDIKSGVSVLRSDVGACWWQNRQRTKQGDLPKADTDQLWDVIKAQKTVLQGFWEHRGQGSRLAECPHCARIVEQFGQVGHSPC